MFNPETRQLVWTQTEIDAIQKFLLRVCQSLNRSGKYLAGIMSRAIAWNCWFWGGRRAISNFSRSCLANMPCLLGDRFWNRHLGCPCDPTCGILQQAPQSDFGLKKARRQRRSLPWGVFTNMLGRDCGTYAVESPLLESRLACILSTTLTSLIFSGQSLSVPFRIARSATNRAARPPARFF